MNKKKKEKKQIKWRKLDNTAKIFPITANEKMTNVFRISVVLKEEINQELLQKALEETLPSFETFGVKLRRGLFWYYFEDNTNIPMIENELSYPCRYIDPHGGTQHLFRVSYYRKRINLEVFHAITDGLGAVNFLKELTCSYLALKAGEHKTPRGEHIFDLEDSYKKNYKKRRWESYTTKRAYQVTGESYVLGKYSMIEGYVDLICLKRICKEKEASITQFISALLIYCIYKEYLKEEPSKSPIAINLPINLRNIFESDTMMNFFAVTNISFFSKGKGHSFEEILLEVKRQMQEKITKDKMEEIIAYNMKFENNPFICFVPLFIKKWATKMVYSRSIHSYTMTFSNLGIVQLEKEYGDQVSSFCVSMGVGRTQPLKCNAISFEDKIMITFSSIWKETTLQRAFFRELSKMGIPILIESNGVSR